MDCFKLKLKALDQVKITSSMSYAFHIVIFIKL
jgi:hypothetical protein